MVAGPVAALINLRLAWQGPDDILGPGGSAVQASASFYPVRPDPPEGPLARYRSLRPAGAARAFVAQFTRPGDLVVDLFCHGPELVREVLHTGRRTLGASANPVNLLSAAMALGPAPDSADLDAAFTHLADSPKGDQPLHRYLTDVYCTRCPACAEEGIAEWFAWDSRAVYPYAKAVRCERCEQVQEGPTDEVDIATTGRFAARGLPYHYALNRVAPVDHPAHSRAAELVKLYTPRNLSALMDVTMRLQALDLESPVRAVMEAVLLEVFDLGSSLDPHGEPRLRPRTLRPPVSFLERNVWLLLEEGLARVALQHLGGDARFELAPDVAALLSDRTPAYALVPTAARGVADLLPGQTTTLILVDPPRPDGVFWALSALWAGWLWETPEAQAMRPFLARRRFEWEWHCEVLRAALSAVGPLLAPDGHLVTLFSDPEEKLVESVCLAAFGSGYELVGWGVEAEVGTQMVWRWAGRQRPSAPQDGPQRTVEALVQGCLRERAEPTPWQVLHAATYVELAAGIGAITPSAGETDEDGPLPGPPGLADTDGDAIREELGRLGAERVGEEPELLWLPALDGEGGEPLADRVEQAVYQVLQARPTWPVEEILQAVYDQFPGMLTPDLPLVWACLDSYARCQEGTCRLREEDDPRRRADELGTLRQELRALGRNLSFRVGGGEGWDLRWRDGPQDVYLFALSATARLGGTLKAGPPVPVGAIPCLVFPGGRAELLAHKLGRDPRLARAVGARGWQLIKFRHLRRLIAEGLDRRTFEAVLGLDPVTGREGVQIPLILGGEQ